MRCFRIYDSASHKESMPNARDSTLTIIEPIYAFRTRNFQVPVEIKKEYAPRSLESMYETS